MVGAIEHTKRKKEDQHKESRGAYIGNRVSFGVKIGQKVMFCEEKEWFRSYSPILRKTPDCLQVQFIYVKVTLIDSRLSGSNLITDPLQQMFKGPRLYPVA